jgi:hypoxanthine phosphoribosyltransferase
MERKYMNYEYEHLFKSMENLRKRVPFYPDIIVGVARGGMVPASLLWRHYPRADFMTLKAKSYNGIFCQGKVFLSPFEWKRLKGKKVLFVDDIYDSGKTWERIQSKIPRYTSHCLATLVSKQLTSPHHITSEFCSEDVWVNFPWEITKERV